MLPIFFLQKRTNLSEVWHNIENTPYNTLEDAALIYWVMRKRYRTLMLRVVDRDSNEVAPHLLLELR